MRGDLRVVGPADPPADASPALLADLVGRAKVLRWSGDDTARAWRVVQDGDGATRSMVEPGLGGAIPGGRPLVGLRTADSSCTHGKGARLPPRPPMQPQAPGGYGARGARGGCTGPAGTPPSCATSRCPVVSALSFNLVPVLVLTLETAAFALLAYYVGTG